MALPVLDLFHFTAGSPSQQAEFADALVKSLQETGFVKLINHGFLQDEVEHLFSQVLKSLSVGLYWYTN